MNEAVPDSIRLDSSVRTSVDSLKKNVKAFGFWNANSFRLLTYFTKRT